jgi:hypothetical protein
MLQMMKLPELLRHHGRPDRPARVRISIRPPGGGHFNTRSGYRTLDALLKYF